MKTYLDCFPCVLRQTLEAARIATSDESKQRDILNRVLELLTGLQLEVAPPEIAQSAHRLIRRISGNPDPYAKIKRESNQYALQFLPELRAVVKKAEEPLNMAVRIAIAGNIVDYGANNGDFDLEEELRSAAESTFGVDHYEHFKTDVLQAKSILYLGDNAGEIVFDMMMVELLKKLSPAVITFVVRGCPVLNDATMQDSDFIGLSRLVQVIDNGSDAPATILSQASPELREGFHQADVIISKGQGNYETLNNVNYNIYFLLKVKCAVIARDIGAPAGSYVLVNPRFLL